MARRRPVPPIDGLCVVDKPAAWTSHDVVAKARGVLGTRKVGHSGTLDPDATGVLVLGVGRATRLLRFLTDLGKSYVGEVVLGTTTSTLDAAGEVTGRFPMDGVTLADVEAAARRFVGEIDQIPPMVSALKVDGRRLHELAREGIEIERQPRRVLISSIEVAPTGEPHVFRLSVSCGSGTYIRSLAADLGTALGGGAHLRNLRRTSVGSFTLAEAHGLEELTLLPMADVLRDYPRLELDADERTAVLQGKRLGPHPVTAPVAPAAVSGGAVSGGAVPVDTVSGGAVPGDAAPAAVAAYGPDGDLVAVVEAIPTGFKPVVVVAAQPSQ